MIQCGGVMMLPGGVVATGRRKGGDDACCTDVNLTGQKMKKIYMINLTATNGSEDLKQ
jgi:hypothetical protein